MSSVFGPGIAAVEYHGLGLHLAVGLERDVLDGEHLSAVAHGQLGLAAGESVALQR